uniref:RING finger protein 141 n=1 Tax=Plectus sambesii TaxID=2011161 RepID=A0A914W0T8_9BILA
MGQNPSSQAGASNDPLVDAGLFIRAQAFDAARVATIGWEEFLQYVSALNEKCRGLIDANGKYLLFALKKGSADTYLWKATVRICCLKMNSLTGKVESRKFLSLVQFLRLHKSLLAMIERPNVHIDTDTPVKTFDNGMTTSILLENVGAGASTSSDENDLSDLKTDCQICMERQPEVILPCAHCYCLVCIERWSEGGHRWCPICREQIKNTDDAWVISDFPEQDEVSNYLMSLADSKA